MQAIFLSYRRDDAEGEAGRLFDDLTGEFGADKVFMDVIGIEPGRDFRKVIDQSVASCGVLLAIIGKGWIDAKDEAGQRRLDDSMDFVRLETSSALKRDIPVIPVLVHGGRMPRAEQLPDDLKDLAYRNGVELTHTRWDSDVQLLIKALRPHVSSERAGTGGIKTQTALDLHPANTAARLTDIASISGTVSVASTRPAKRSLRIGIVAASAAIVIVAGTFGVYKYFKAEEARVAAQAAAKQADEDRRLAAERGEAGKTASFKQTSEQASDENASRSWNKPAAGVTETKSPMPSSIPDFAGAWQMFENSNNGEGQAVTNQQLLNITQNGSLVQIGDRKLQITSSGSVTYQTFAAHDDKYGHLVATEGEADLVDTFTWRLEGSILVFETIFNYRNPYYNHPRGTDLRIMKYRRISPVQK